MGCLRKIYNYAPINRSGHLYQQIQKEPIYQQGAFEYSIFFKT